jgi:hypothetical protein
MATLIEQPSPALTIGPIVGRGITAAHGALAGAFYLFLLHAPAQVFGALAQHLQTETIRAHPGEVEAILLTSLLSLGSFVLAVAVFFLFPFVQGGILAQVRNRIETPHQPPGSFAAYGRAYYVRLLGSLGLFTLLTFLVMAPFMCLMMAMVFQVFLLTPEAPPADQQFTRLFLMNPVTMWTSMVVVTLLAAAVGLVYWVANCLLVSTSAGVIECWRQSLRFARQNPSAWIAICLLIVAVSCAIAPLGMAGQIGLVTSPWAVAGIALGYAALIGYTGVLFAGLVMSLVLARRVPAAQPVDVAQEPRHRSEEQ